MVLYPIRSSLYPSQSNFVDFYLINFPILMRSYFAAEYFLLLLDRDYPVIVVLTSEINEVQGIYLEVAHGV